MGATLALNPGGTHAAGTHRPPKRRLAAPLPHGPPTDLAPSAPTPPLALINRTLPTYTVSCLVPPIFATDYVKIVIHKVFL